MKLDSHDDFEKAYQQYAQAIYRFIYWQTKDPVLSQDLASGVFERAWRSRHSFRGTSPQAWLYRIARNLLIDHWRKKKEVLMDDIQGLSEQLADLTEPPDYDHKQLVQQLDRSLGRLPNEQRLVVVLRFIEGLSAKEAAVILGVSEGNVRVMQFRALRKLRGLFDHE